MRLRAVALFLLVVTGVSAAASIWYCSTSAQVFASTDELAALRIDALVERAGRFDAAVSTFARGREADVAWFTSTSDLVNDLHARAAELDAALPGIAMTQRARLAEVLLRAREGVDGARANFDTGSTLMALDAVESNGLPAAAALWSELKALRAAVHAEIAALERRWWQRATVAGAAWALSWALGLVWLARRRPAPGPAVESGAAAAPEPASVTLPDASPAVAPALSIAEVADVCERIGRVRDAADVPTLLAHSAAALQAAGLVLWIPDNEALVVAAAHGYPDDVARRLGRVPLADENLLTRAWHSGRPQTSPAANDRRAAFAAPLVGAGGSMGVLAAEVMPGADVEGAAGMARLVAGQFAAVLADTADTVAGTQESAGDPTIATPNALAG
jgi:hypothetical protein